MTETIARNNTSSSYNGFAAEDLEDKSTILKVICPELIPNSASGSLAPGLATGATALKDRDGNSIQAPINITNHIVATWMGESNMREPPMIRRGEPVKIYKVGNQDKFYWRATGMGREFRTTDRVRVEIGATDPSKPGVAKTDENTYSAYLDSVTKKVGFRTSQANGEVTAFSMEADLAQGVFHLSDNSASPGNRIFLDTGATSGVPVIQLNLSSGATLRISGDDIFIKAPGKLMIDVGERFIINSPLTIFNIATVGVVIMNAATVAINSTRDFVINAATIGLNGATKVSGTLVAASARIADLVKGAYGSNYSGVSISRPEETPPITPSNSPDTGMTGIPYQT